MYPGQEEIYNYLVGVAEKWGLFKHIRFNSSVEEAVWSDSDLHWKVKVNVSGEKTAQFGSEYIINAGFLVSGVGQLNSPHYPEIEGLDDFKGKVMHSARWDWSYNLDGKKICIIGSGATSAQIIPEVSKVAQSVTVFQRTPNWITPREDGPIGPVMHAALNYVPGLRSRYRALMMDLREAMYDSTIVKNSAGNDALRDFCTEFMHRQVPNRPELWEKLTPSYAPGCKRVLISDDFYPAMAQEHVHLETDKIKKITERGVIVTHEDGSEQEFECDLLVCATGFRTNEFMYPMKVVGRNGTELGQVWHKGAHAFLGITVEDMPNFAMMYGPNTNLGHNSIILMIEAQSNYINGMIAPLLEAKKQGKRLAAVPKTQRVQEWNVELQEKLKGLTFADPACQSWYKTAEGLVTNNWSGTVIQYQKDLSVLEWSRDFEILGDGNDIVSRRIKSSGKEHIGRVVEETVVPVIALTTYSALAAVAYYGWKVASKTDLVRSAVGKVF